LSLDHVELNDLLVPDTAKVLFGIVLDNGCLVDEYILFGVFPVNETVTITDIEPFHHASDFCSYNVDNLF